MTRTDSGASTLASRLELAAVLGADRQERTDKSLGYRNGSRPRLLITQEGDIPLSIR